MSRRWQTCVLCIAAITVLVSSAILISRASTESPPVVNLPSSSARFQNEGGNVREVTNARDLALQPEANRLLRRVGGQRFRLKTPPVVIMHGVLTTGSDPQDVQLSRYQEPSGERVELALAGGTRLLSWNAISGARSSTGTLGLIERAILERLIFDSADQFILAQLRGASYQTVTRNLRPDDAPDNYAGPLWDVVRIDDPESDEQKRPLSQWRLYYLNLTTGLIDKIVSTTEGQRIEANLSDWRKRGGEEFPSTIVWTRDGQPLMTLNLTNVSLVAQ